MTPSAVPSLSFCVAVFIGGAVGSLLRFVVAHYSLMWWGPTFPWGTLAVNLFGSLWLGFFGGLVAAKPAALDPNVRFLLTTGFAGGLTTWSSLAFETLALHERGDTLLAAMNMGANVVLGMVLVWVGVLIARAI